MMTKKRSAKIADRFVRFLKNLLMNAKFKPSVAIVVLINGVSVSAVSVEFA